MKKVLIILLVAFVCAAVLYADAYKDANKLIKQGLKDSNIRQIKEISLSLTPDQKQSLYTWNKVSTIGPFLSNLFLGFGSGSTRQGDTLHGVLFLAGDAHFDSRRWILRLQQLCHGSGLHRNFRRHHYRRRYLP